MLLSEFDYAVILAVLDIEEKPGSRFVFNFQHSRLGWRRGLTLSLMFEVGCDPESEEFKEYWSRNGYGQEDKGYSHDRLLEELVDVIEGDFSQLIVWRENGKIVGHSAWHESNAEEHRKVIPETGKIGKRYRSYSGAREALLSFTNGG